MAGIKVCDRWTGKNGWQNFFSDMGQRPSNKHSIDRFPDPKGNYEPTNCRWATVVEQANNRKTNRRITYRGTTLNVGEWAAKLGILSTTIRQRLDRGWPVAKALSPVNR